MPTSIHDLARFFEASPNPYLVLDRDLNIAAANGAYLASVNRELSDIVGRWAWDAFPADEHRVRQVIDSFERVIRTKRSDTMALLRFDVPSSTAEGGFERRYWSITHTPVLDDAGEVEFVLQHPIDVTALEALRQTVDGGTADILRPDHSGIFDRAEAVYAANQALAVEAERNGAVIASLAEERERLVQLFEQAPGFMTLLTGPEHRFQVANAGYRQLIGRRPIIGRTVAEALGEAAEQGYVDLLDQVFATGEPYRAHAARYSVQPTPGGPSDERYVDFIFQPIRGGDGAVAGILVQGVDVTDRMRAADVLDATERHYRSVLEAIDVGFCIIELIFEGERPVDYRFVETNSAFERHTGLVDAVGKTARELIPDLEPHWFEQYGGVASSGTQIRFESGSAVMDRWFDVHALRVDPPDARRVALLFNDISDRRRAELALQSLNEQLEARVAAALAEQRILADIVDGADAFVQVLDRDYRWIAFNKAAADEFERLFGVVPRVGEDMLALLADQPEQGAAVEAGWARALAGERFVEVGQFADGGSFYEMRFSPLRDATGKAIGAYQFVYDVSERVGEQQRLAQAEEQLRQAQKMEAVGQLTGGLAHDFNNLLTGMMGNLELLQTRVARGRLEDLDRFVLAAQGAGRRAAALTQRLLAFSRRQTLDPKPTDVNRLIAGMEDLLRRTVGPANTIEVVGAAGLWTADIDAGQLENALLNLCINARDAMPDGGRITIETANKWLDDRSARERDLPPGQYLSICVTDTGTGMTPDIVERVFEPFFTTKPLGEGTGLGLSMIYGFARQSNGQVRIYSEVGAGTTICIYLPRHLGAAVSSDEVEAIAAAVAATGETILVVDDEATVRHLIDEVLDDAGYTVIGAADGAAGIKVLQSGARIELLITDVGLPGGMNGRQVADAARLLRPGLKVLFITGYAENAAVGNGHLEPGMELLTKPFTMDALTTKVADMMKRGSDARRIPSA